MSSTRFDEMGVDNISIHSIPSIDDDDLLANTTGLLGEQHLSFDFSNKRDNIIREANAQKKHDNNRRREFGEVVEEVVDESSDSEKYISPGVGDNKYLEEVNQLLGKAKAERENSPKKQTPDTARFLSKIKKSLEDNLDDVIEESTRLLKEALPMFSYETKQGTRENFSDLIKQQSPSKNDLSTLSSTFDDLPITTISKPINEFPYHSSEYRKNKKLSVNQDHDDISTKFFPHLHETIQRSTPLKNKRLKSNVVKTSKSMNRDDNEYYAKSTEILPNNVENRHVYETDEDPSPNREKPPQPKMNETSTITEPLPRKNSGTMSEEKQSVQKIIDEIPETVLDYINTNKEIDFESASSPVVHINPQVDSRHIDSSDPVEKSSIEQLYEVKPQKFVHQNSKEPNQNNEEDQLTEKLCKGLNSRKRQYQRSHIEKEAIEKMDILLPSPISKDLDHIGFQDIIRELTFTTESILRSCSSSSFDIAPSSSTTIPVVRIPQREEQSPKEIPDQSPETPKIVKHVDPSIPFSPMIYDQYSPIHNIPSPLNSPITPRLSLTRKKVSSSNTTKKKGISTPREQDNTPPEESFVPYSGVRHLQKTTYNHSTIDWYLNLCSNKYSRTPNAHPNNDKGIVKWV